MTPERNLMLASLTLDEVLTRFPELREFASLVSRMRAKQKAFFKSKDRELLRECTDLERRVDAEAARLLQPSLPFDAAEGGGP